MVSSVVFLILLVASRLILIPRRAILHDEKTYPDPFTFNPERFLKDGKLDPSVTAPEVAAFGYARRIWFVSTPCPYRLFSPTQIGSPGIHMALDSIWLTAGSVLAAFDIKKAINPDGTVIEPSGKFLPAGITS